MGRYRHEVLPHGKGHCYRILEGDREVLRSGAFLYAKDADSVGRHFAADDDLEAYLKR